MTDAAKIGLLVTQNIQQFQTNQILAQVHSEACRTNQYLGQMASTLDQIAHMQATHFEQVQRERSLKEVMFQFGKFLDETETYGDSVAAAFGMKRLFEILDQPGNGFSTADLSDLGDKRHFDGLTTRAKGLLTGLPHQQFEEMEQFEQLLGVYYERRAIGFNADKAFPKKQHIKLSKEYRQAPQISTQIPQANALTSAKTTESVAQLKAGCGVIVLGFGLLILLVLISELSGISHSKTPPPPGVLPVGLFALVGGGALLWSYWQGKNQRQAMRESAEKEQKLAEKQFQKKKLLDQQSWEAKKQEEEGKVAKANQKIDADNAEIDEKRRQATKLFQATMEEMRSLLNKFLDQHPPIQKFVARV